MLYFKKVLPDYKSLFKIWGYSHLLIFIIKYILLAIKTVKNLYHENFLKLEIIKHTIRKKKCYKPRMLTHITTI